MKKILLSFFLTGFYLTCIAQMPDSTKNIDLRAQIQAAKIKTGSQLVYTDMGMQLYVKIKNGKVIDYFAKDSKGNLLKIDFKTYGLTTCTACILMGNGKWRCYDVDCKAIPAPRSILKQ